ncbi:MAG: hypothetical protein HXY48_10510 [Ignavibacteriaceae bacterium]|nr:hypothetical protein [Ignavibacteriaceae bacterium]
MQNQIEIQKKVVKAWELFAQKEMEKSLVMMIAAADLEDASEKKPRNTGSVASSERNAGGSAS